MFKGGQKSDLQIEFSGFLEGFSPYWSKQKLYLIKCKIEYFKERMSIMNFKCPLSIDWYVLLTTVPF